MSKSQKPSPDTQTNQDADKDLRELLTEVGEQAALRSAEKRRAIEETLLQPDMLNLLEGLVADLSGVPSEKQPEETSESHWTSRLHPDWTEDKLAELDGLDIEILMKAPGLSPAQIEHIAQTS